MLAVFTAPDALVVGSVLTAAVTGLYTLKSAREAAKQSKPNGGRSMRDAVDRIEKKMDGHGERLAVLEDRIARDPNARSRATDKEE